MFVYINGSKIKFNLSPSDSHFHDINIIGSDFLEFFAVELRINYKQAKVTMEFHDVPPKTHH